MDSTTCLELALEGERLCKRGEFANGVTYFEAAIRVGTDDLKTLSAIYSQLGNAYFYLGDYNKAMEYHKCDLTVARTIGDKLGEAKASGNLGNTWKVLGKFDEAIFCCRKHLLISREIGDKVGEGRALYNLGNVYHAKSKHIARTGSQDPGDFPDEVKACLQKAVTFYEENYKLMLELKDRSAQGKACGNLGNTHYLLGNFSQAILYHEERLRIAKEFGDKAAERRAFSNMGNAHIFLGAFEIATENYRKTLSLAKELRDRAAEAQACYSLGNTYTLLHEYDKAIEYHLCHLAIAQELMDRVGESRAYWSLGNTYSALGEYEAALNYANKHLHLSKEIGDHTGEITAQMSICDMKKMIEIQNAQNASPENRSKRRSMENMDLMSLTPNAKIPSRHSEPSASKSPLSTLMEVQNELPQAGTSSSSPKGKSNPDDRDKFYDLVTRFQSQRMDDQRCCLDDKENNQFLGNQHSQPESQQPLQQQHQPAQPRDDLFEMIAGMQSRRLDEQRADLPAHGSVRRRVNINNNVILRRTSMDATTLPDDDFFDMLMRCQGSRLEDQRSSMPDVTLPTVPPTVERRFIPPPPPPTRPPVAASTVPDDDFYSLILRLQSGRIEDQRSNLPKKSQNLPPALRGRLASGKTKH